MRVVSMNRNVQLDADDLLSDPNMQPSGAVETIIASVKHGGEIGEVEVVRDGGSFYVAGGQENYDRAVVANSLGYPVSARVVGGTIPENYSQVPKVDVPGSVTKVPVHTRT